MENIQVFEYRNNKVRTVDVDGEAWFVLASAICQKKACLTSGSKS